MLEATWVPTDFNQDMPKHSKPHDTLYACLDLNQTIRTSHGLIVEIVHRAQQKAIPQSQKAYVRTSQPRGWLGQTDIGANGQNTTVCISKPRILVTFDIEKRTISWSRSHGIRILRQERTRVVQGSGVVRPMDEQSRSLTSEVGLVLATASAGR